MAGTYTSIADIARLIGSKVRRRNPITTWGIVAILPSGDSTIRRVLVRRFGTVRPATFLPPVEPLLNKAVLVTGMGDATGTPYVIATAYQIPWEPDYAESPIYVFEYDSGPDGVPGTADDGRYLLVDDDGYVLTDE